MLKISFYLRLSAVCAAITFFIMCLDAARATPMTAQVDGAVTRVTVRRLHAPSSRPVFTGRQTAGTGTRSSSESEMSWSYSDRSSVSDRPSHALWFGKDSSSYIQNTPDDRWSRAREAGMGERPQNDVFTSYKPREQRFERPPMIIRKSSPREAATLFKQEFHSAQVWEPGDARISLREENVKGKVAADKALVSSPSTGRHWGTSPPTSHGRYGSYRHTNELSSEIQFSKFPSLASQASPRVPFVSIGSVASVTKNRETPSSSGFHLLSSQPPKGRSYLFEHSHTPSGGLDMVNTVAADDRRVSSARDHKQSLPGAHTYSTLSRFQQPQRDNPGERPLGVHRIRPLSSTVNVGQYKYQDSATAEEPKSSQKSVISNLVNTTTRGSALASKPGQTPKSIYGIRGFKNPAMKEPSNLSSSDHTFKKGRFKMANVHPYLSAKYSFGQRDTSTTPDRHEKTPVDLRASLRGFKEAPPQIPENDAFVDQNPVPRQLKIYRKTHHHKGFGPPPLEGAKPLINKPDKPVKVQQGYEELKLRSSQISQAESSRIPRWFNRTEPGSSQSGGNLNSLLKRFGSVQTGVQFTPDKYRESRKVYAHLGFHPVQRRTGKETSESQWAHQEQTPADHGISSAYLRSAWDLKVEPGSKSEPRPPGREKPMSMKAWLLSSSTSSIVRGKRVRGKKLGESSSLSREAGNVTIVRLNKRPPALKAVVYADILGSASFSGVRATIQTPTATNGEASSPNATTVTRQEEGAGPRRSNPEDAGHNMSRGPEAEGGFSNAVEDVSGDLGPSNPFLDDSEGSGSEGLDVTDGLSNHTHRVEGDLLERDYLRISTGNISFKSLKLFHTLK